MTDAVDGSRATQRRKYPVLHLEQAIKRAEEIFQHERRSMVPPAILMKHWGYNNPKSGIATSTVSALRQFGLLTDDGSGSERRTGISDRAYTILHAPEDIRSKAIREAAMEPPIHRLIWKKYGADTGSYDGFRWFLMNDLKFSARGADDFVKQYQATITFAGIDAESDPDVSELTADDAEAPSSDDGVPPWEVVDEEARDLNELQSSNTAPARPTYPPMVDVWQSEGQRVEVQRPEVPVSSTIRRHSIPLPGGKQIVVEGDFPVSEATWQQFLTVLEAFKPGLVETTDAEGNVEGLC